MREKNKQTESLPRNFIFRGEGFAIAYANYFFDEKLNNFRKILTSKKHRIDSESFTYRIINHWEKHDLIEAEREGGTGWRKISLLDGVWLRILNELRGFGLSIETIKALKKNLKYLLENEAWELFEFYVAHAMVPKDAVYLLAFKDGTCELVTQGEYGSALNMGTLENHLKISINEILSKMFPKKDLVPKDLQLISLNDKERKILSILRFENFDSIKITRKNGEMNLVEISKTENISEKFQELVKKGDYQKIEFIVDDNKVRTIKRSEKRKL
jgi:DNA-binding transcriptional MerR regulator